MSRYSKKAIPQLASTIPIIPNLFWNKAAFFHFKCPYQASVINVLEATNKAMVYSVRMLGFADINQADGKDNDNP
jgi:membrane protein CcdC involved in cytochrome C biogenesis